MLVAFAILSLSLGALMQAFSVGLRNTALAEDYTTATLHAESLLAGIGVEEVLEEGSLGGEIDERFRWQATVEEYIDEGLSGDGFFDDVGELPGDGVVADGADGEDPDAAVEDGGRGDSAEELLLPVTLYRVALDVLWEDGGRTRSVGLETLRLVNDDDF